MPADQLVAGIQLVARGDALRAPSVTRRLIVEFSRSSPGRPDAPPAGLDELTPRELEVFRLLARHVERRGGRRADRSETTVKTHVARVLMKLGVRGRVQAVVLAYGLIAPGAMASE